MKQVSWIDKSGYKRVSLLRDNDPDYNAEQGVPIGPPDTRRLDWTEISRDLNNELLTNNLLTINDVAENPNLFTGTILSAIRSRLITLYRK